MFLFTFVGFIVVGALTLILAIATINYFADVHDDKLRNSPKSTCRTHPYLRGHVKMRGCKL